MLTHSRVLEEKSNPVLPRAYRYTNDKFPCLVSHGADLEDLPSLSVNRDEYYRVNARNALRHLTYGKPLFKGSFFKWSNLKLAWLNFKALTLKRDRKLLAALRHEMKIIFQNAYQISQDCDPETEKRLEIFISTLLSNFPFMDPQKNETVLVPQKINNIWRQVEYKFKKIDLSPQKGLWSKLLEEEDRLYAYGMEPQDSEANPYLLLMGTTYFSGQGSGLSLLGDLTAGQSVGERHDLTDLEKWILRHRKIKITGHSQGGTMAMIVAAKYPEFTLQADSLNPTALHQSTLRKLRPWWQHPRKQNPQLNVYTQKGDPVFIFGEGFLPGTRIFQIDHSQSAKNSKLTAHAHHYSGHALATYEELTAEQITQNAPKRKFLNDLKAVADWTFGPLLGFTVITSLLKRKIQRFCSQHAQAVRIFLMATGLATLVALSLTGVLAPLTTALVLPSVVPAMQGLVGAGLLMAAAVTVWVAPKLINLAISLMQAAISFAASSLALGAFVLGSLVASVKALTSVCSPARELPGVQPELATRSTHSRTHEALVSLGQRLNLQVAVNSQPILKRSHSESEVSSLSLLRPKPQAAIESREGVGASLLRAHPITP